MKRRLNGRLLLSLLGGVALLGIGVHLIHGAQVKRNSRALLGQADRAEQQGDLEKAEDYLSRYLAYQPRDMGALSRYGRLLEERAKTPVARFQVMEVYEKVLRRDPSRREIRRRVVDLAMDPLINELSDAQSHLETLLKSSPNDKEKGELTSLLGRCKEGLGKPEEAMALYEEARKLAPGQVEAYARLAALFRSHDADPSAWDQADRVMDARAVKDGLIAANSRSAAAYLARAAYRKKYDIPGASDDLTRALELAPDDPDALLAGAEEARDRKDLDRARSLLRHGTERHPRNVPLCRQLAELEALAGRFDEAIKGLRHAIELSPDELGLRWSLAELLIQAGRIEGPEGAEAAIQILKEKNARPELLAYLDARASIQQRRWSRAARVLSENLAALSAQSEGKEVAKRALMMLGQCHEAMGNVDASQDAYRRAVSIDLAPDPLWAAARLGLAASLVRQNKIDDGLAEYRIILRSGRASGIGGTVARLLILRNLRLPASDRHWEEVEQILGDLERSSPDSTEVPVLRAESLAAQNQPGPARDLLVKARDQHPEKADLWFALASLAASGDKLDAGLAVLDEADRRLGDGVDLRLARARLLARRGGEPARAALEGLERGAEKFTTEEQAQLWRGLAAAYSQAGATAPADRLWAKLADRDPNDLIIQIIRFDRALTANDAIAAREILGRVRRVEGDEGILWRFGEAALRIQQARKSPGDRAALTEARRLLDYVAERRVNWSRVWLALAEVDDLVGDPEAAIKNYLRAIIQLGERNPSAVRRVVQLLYERQRYSQATLVFQKLREDQTPISGELQRLDADISLRTQDYGRALELAEKSVSERSEDYRELLWLGQIRAAAGQPAEPVLRRAVTLAGDTPLVWVALVSYLAGTKQKDKAEAVTREAETKLSGEQAPLALAQCYELIGRADRAGELYQAALKARPDHLPSLRNAASFQLRSGHIEEGKSHLRRIIGLKTGTPDAEWAAQTLAVVTAAGGGFRQSREALEILGIAGKDSEGRAASPAILRTRAKVLAIQPNRASRQDAIAILEDVIQRNDPLPEDLFLLAQLCEANGDWPKARLNMLRLLGTRNPEPTYLAHYTRGLLRHNDLNESQLYLSKLEQVAPRQPFTIEIKARLLTAQKKSDEAIALLTAFARENPALVGITARLLEELGYTDAAEKTYRQFVAKLRRPTDILLLAEFLGRRGRLQEAIDLCDRAWPSCPPEAIANASVRILYGAKGDEVHHRRVGQRLEEAIQKYPDKVSLLFDLANLRILQGRYADAEVIFRGISERNPSLSSPLNNLAWMLAMKEGDKSQALPLITKAITLDGETPDMLDTRALIYLATGQTDLAIRDLENAIAVSPTTERYFHLARAFRAAGKRDEANEAFQKAKERGLTLDTLHPLERPAFLQLSGEMASK